MADRVSGVTAVIRYLQVEAHPLREPFSRCGDAPTRAVTDWSITILHPGLRGDDHGSLLRHYVGLGAYFNLHGQLLTRDWNNEMME